MEITIERNLEQLLRRLRRKRLLSPSANLYVEGIKCKFTLAYYCIEVLSHIEHLDDSQMKISSGSSTIELNLNMDNQVLLYCDLFWNLLRSSIDILAQLINELRTLGISEKKVYFDNVSKRIRSIALNTPLQKAMGNLEKSKVFKELNEYRRCVTHRRPVFVRKDFRQINYSTSGTPGYIYSESATQVSMIDRYLCKNPWDISPLVDTTRPVASFNQNILLKIEKRLNTIINRLP